MFCSATQRKKAVKNSGRRLPHDVRSAGFAHRACNEIRLTLKPLVTSLAISGTVRLVVRRAASEKVIVSTACHASAALREAVS